MTKRNHLLQEWMFLLEGYRQLQLLQYSRTAVPWPQARLGESNTSQFAVIIDNSPPFCQTRRYSSILGQQGQALLPLPFVRYALATAFIPRAKSPLPPSLCRETVSPAVVVVFPQTNTDRGAALATAWSI